MSKNDLAEYLASDTDLPYRVWLQERDALARARVTQPPARPLGWALTLLIAIVLAGGLLAICAVIARILRGHP